MQDRIRDRVDRSLGQVMAIGGSIAIGGAAITKAASLGDYSWWWLALCGLVLLSLTALGYFGHVLPMPVLRFGWAAVPAMVAIAQITTYFAYNGSFPEEKRLWLGIIAPTVAITLLLWMPVKRALIAACVISVLPAVSSLLVFGPVMTAAWTNAPYYLSGVAAVLLFVLIRGSLLQLRREEAAAEDQELRRDHAVARASEEARLARLVHDEVLASFSVAMNATGVPSASLRNGAAEALRVLEAKPSLDPVRGGKLSGVELDARFRALAAAHDCGYELEIEGPAVCTDASGPPNEPALGPPQKPAFEAALEAASVPTAVTETLLAATTEALRNSVHHAGESARRYLRCMIDKRRVRVSLFDDGIGFDRSAIDPRRFGVQRSIIAPMQALPTGSASVASTPGEGTRVVLEWLA